MNEELEVDVPRQKDTVAELVNVPPLKRAPLTAASPVVLEVANTVGFIVIAPEAGGGGAAAALRVPANGPAPTGAAAAVGAAEITTARTVDRTIRATINMLNALFCLLLAFMVFVWGSPARSQSGRWLREQNTKYKNFVNEWTRARWTGRADSLRGRLPRVHLLFRTRKRPIPRFYPEPVGGGSGDARAARPRPTRARWG